jgi:hypothetical protein
MGFQSGTILVIMVYVTFLPWLERHRWVEPARYFRDFGIWGTIVITLYSGLAYIRRAAALFKQPTERTV